MTHPESLGIIEVRRFLMGENRRQFLRFLLMSIAAGGCSHIIPSKHCQDCGSTHSSDGHHHGLPLKQERPKLEKVSSTDIHHEDDLKQKSQKFDETFGDDIVLEKELLPQAKSLLEKLSQYESYVGHGYFNLKSFSQFETDLEAMGLILSSQEKSFASDLFDFDAQKYGFMGEKVITSMEKTFSNREVVKVPYSGHFLLDGESTRLYHSLVADVGNSLILTSGVRGTAKQFKLFLQKADEVDFNLSKASRSLAPPGYSHHGKGDFDVGRKGGGLANFTEDFARTFEFKEMIKLGYVDIRYQELNLLGVRFEPWHIKVHG